MSTDLLVEQIFLSELKELASSIGADLRCLVKTYAESPSQDTARELERYVELHNCINKILDFYLEELCDWHLEDTVENDMQIPPYLMSTGPMGASSTVSFAKGANGPAEPKIFERVGDKIYQRDFHSRERLDLNDHVFSNREIFILENE